MNTKMSYNETDHLSSTMYSNNWYEKYHGSILQFGHFQKTRARLTQKHTRIIQLNTNKQESNEN